VIYLFLSVVGADGTAVVMAGVAVGGVVLVAVVVTVGVACAYVRIRRFILTFVIYRLRRRRQTLPVYRLTVQFSIMKMCNTAT